MAFGDRIVGLHPKGEIQRFNDRASGNDIGRERFALDLAACAEEGQVKTH